MARRVRNGEMQPPQIRALELFKGWGWTGEALDDVLAVFSDDYEGEDVFLACLQSIATYNAWRGRAWSELGAPA